MDHYIDPRIIEALQAAARRERSKCVHSQFFRLGQWLRALWAGITGSAAPQPCC